MEDAAKALARGKFAVALTGAEIGAESGVPTFRGPSGLWERYKPEELATPEAFARNPELVWRWCRWRQEVIYAARPSPGHAALAELEALGGSQGCRDAECRRATPEGWLQEGFGATRQHIARPMYALRPRRVSRVARRGGAAPL